MKIIITNPDKISMKRGVQKGDVAKVVKKDSFGGAYAQNPKWGVNYNGRDIVFFENVEYEQVVSYEVEGKASFMKQQINIINWG